METDWAGIAAARRCALDATAYRGADRRGLIRGNPPSRLLWTALLATTVLLGGVLVMSGLEVAPATIRSGALRGPLGVASVPVSLLLALLCHLYWRLVGAAAAAFLTPATTLLAVAGAADALAFVADLDADPLGWLRFVSLLAALLLAGMALLAPDVDARLHPRRLTVSSGTAVLAASAVVVSIAGAVGVAPPERGGAVDAALALAWMLLGACYFRTSVRDGRPLIGWFGILFSSIGYGYLVTLFGAGVLPLVGFDLLELTGMLAASGGAVRALTLAWSVQGSRLLQAEHQRHAAEARAQAELARQAERAHEACNALVAIEGATRMLRDCSHRLPERDRDQLSAAVSAEIARLRLLVTADTAPEGFGPFRLAEALSAVVACERSFGVAISCDVPDELIAFGSPSDTAEAVQNLLQNARRYAGSAVAIHAVVDDERVVLRVSDQGPGVPSEDRERIFERGWRGASGRHLPGSGLGLHVSRRLMERQGGDLWVEAQDHRDGACFTLRLPGFSIGGTGMFSVPDLLVDEVADKFDEPSQARRRHVRLLDPVAHDPDDVSCFAEQHDAASGQLIW